MSVHALKTPEPANDASAPEPQLEPFRCDVDADIFRKVASVCGSEDGRNWLHGVKIEPRRDGGRGVLMIATDGHSMLIFCDESGEMTGEGGVVCLPPALLKACKPGRYRSERLSVSETGAATVGALSAPKCVLDVSFPEWRRVMPSGLDAKAPANSVNPDKLKVIGAALQGDSAAPGVRCFGEATDDASYPGPYLVLGWDTRGFGLLMGLRFERGPDLPAWIA